jgi:hypothetical protein
MKHEQTGKSDDSSAHLLPATVNQSTGDNGTRNQVSFDSFLGSLSDNQDLREKERMVMAKEMYTEWANAFTLLRTNFEEAAAIARQIENQLVTWSVKRTSYPQWDVMGMSGYGYNFGFDLSSSESLEGNTIRKLISVNCGTEFRTAGNGIGDEREIGGKNMSYPEDGSLLGFDFLVQERKLGGQSLISACERMLKQLRAQPVRISISRSNSTMTNGACSFTLTPEDFVQNPLKILLQNIFIRLNNDEFIGMEDYISNIALESRTKC